MPSADSPPVRQDARVAAYVKGRRVVITGPAQGIGREIARIYAAHGAQLALADVLDLSSVVEECKSLGAEDVIQIRFDAGKAGEGARMVSEAAAHWGGAFDVLVLNHTVGIFSPMLQEPAPYAVAERNIRINYLAYVEIQLAAMEPLLAAARARREAAFASAQPGCCGSGVRLPPPSSLIVISSLAARIPMLNTHGYAASKAAINAWFDCLECELRYTAPELSSLLALSMVYFSAIKTETLLKALGPTDGPNKRALAFAAPPHDAAWAVVRAGVQRRRLACFPSSIGVMVPLYNLWPSLARAIVQSVVVKQSDSTGAEGKGKGKAGAVTNPVAVVATK